MRDVELSEKVANTEKIAEIVDKIFLQNHHIVNQMVEFHQNKEVRVSPVLREITENVEFKKLQDLFVELRKLIKEAIKIDNDLMRSGIDGAYDNEAAEDEILYQSSESTKGELIGTIQTRLDALFMSMNIVTIGLKNENQTLEMIESIYYQKPERELRRQEYSMLEESVRKQLAIVDYEEIFASYHPDKGSVLSPLVSIMLIDSISDTMKYGLAEKQCKRYVEDSRKQEKVFDEYPELKETMEQVEYLEMEERYKRKFESAAGVMNARTSYAKRFAEWYKQGLLPTYTQLSKAEIHDRMQSHMKAYTDENKEKIQDAFSQSVERHKSIRAKRNLKNLPSILKFEAKDFVTAPKKFIRKIRNTKVKQIQKDLTVHAYQELEQEKQKTQKPQTKKEPKEQEER